MAVSRLDHRDIASVVMFDDTADVVMQAQPVHDSGLFVDAIQQICARGSTAIHAGVLVGADEVRRYKEPQRLNRVILLSDGQANAALRARPISACWRQRCCVEGISVSTIGLGLGYNEDLMLALARAGDGNHAFAREPTDLVQIFNKEFDDVLASCAADRLHRYRAQARRTRGARAEPRRHHRRQPRAVPHEPGLRRHRALRADGARDRQGSGPSLGNGEQELGIVKVAYTLPGNGARETQDTHIRARLGATEEEVKASADKKVAEAVIEQVTRGRTQEAILLRDAGKTEEAKKLLMQNAAEINAFVKSAPGASQRLRDLEGQYSANGLSPCAGLPLAAGPAAQGAAQPGKHRRRLRHALLRNVRAHCLCIPQARQRAERGLQRHARALNYVVWIPALRCAWPGMTRRGAPTPRRSARHGRCRSCAAACASAR